jgi:protein-S-isoprenylcysteine O-methyltransferase Ste14
LSGLHLFTFVLCSVTVATFVVAAGACFVPFRRDPVGLNMVKLTAPVSWGAEIYAMLTSDLVVGGRALVACCLFFVSLGLFLWAVWVNRRSPLSRIYCKDPPIHLVTRGPYRLVRHPCYSAYLLAFSAGLVATCAWWLLVVIVFNLALFIHAAFFEEQKFECSRLASAYARYRARTGMFLPSPLKLLRRRRR